VNEILIVTGSKEAWFGSLGDTIRGFFARQMPGVSQPEPLFDLLNIPDKFLNDVYKKHHNIFIVDIVPSLSVVQSETKKDLWSSPQRVIKVTAPDTASFYQEFELKKSAFLKYFDDLELERTTLVNMMANDIKLIGQVEKKFGISLNLPGGFFMSEETQDFAWLRHTIHKAKQDIELGILIYSAEYIDTSMFSPDYIIQWRNTITRQFVPGPSVGSYMKVAQEFIPPVFERINDFPAGFAVVTRGIWDVENDFMGGSFINYTFLNQEKNRIVVLDGYVYNPNDSKKDYLRQLQSIFYTLKFSAEE